MEYSGRPRVTLSVPPDLADLDSWGLDIGGEWWALVTWTEWASPPDLDGHPYPVNCAAWVAGATVTQPMQPIYYLHVPRTRLPAEPAHWPQPTSRPGAVWQGGYYFGPLEHGEKPELPAEAGEAWGNSMGSAYG